MQIKRCEKLKLKNRNLKMGIMKVRLGVKGED